VFLGLLDLSLSLLNIYLKKRGRRSKLTWEETAKEDLKGWDIPKDLALNRSTLKTVIHMLENLDFWFYWVFNSNLPQLAWDKRLCCCCILIVGNISKHCPGK
jgi:signal recognition particle subunit SEC65